MTDAFHSILGLPKSGKTTFLAALWHSLDSGEVETRLTLDKLVGNNDYLNRIVEAWMRCEKVPRTSTAAEVNVAIHVLDKAEGTRMVLGFPDLSGESFQGQFENRRCETAYVESYDRPGGMLLFVNADKPIDGLNIVDIAAITGGYEEPAEEQVEVAWKPELVPEQTRLVDLLQFVQGRPFLRRRRRLAVMVSAWDVIDDDNLSPRAWLEREMPLLYQFLVNNDHSFELAVFGISAQGGDVHGSQRQALLAKGSKRIRCIDGATASNDITTPVAWLNGNI